MNELRGVIRIGMTVLSITVMSQSPRLAAHPQGILTSAELALSNHLTCAGDNPLLILISGKRTNYRLLAGARECMQCFPCRLLSWNLTLFRTTPSNFCLILVFK